MLQQKKKKRHVPRVLPGRGGLVLAGSPRQDGSNLAPLFCCFFDFIGQQRQRRRKQEASATIAAVAAAANSAARSAGRRPPRQAQRRQVCPLQPPHGLAPGPRAGHARVPRDPRLEELEQQKQQQRRKGVAVLDDGGGLGSRAAALTAGLLRARADVALLLLDAKDGVTPVDEALARWLRRSLGAAGSATPPENRRRPAAATVVVAVNKAEAARSNPRVAAAVAEAGALGFGEGVGVSAETGEGMAER